MTKENETIKQENLDEADQKEIRQLFEQLDDNAQDSFLGEILKEEHDITEVEVKAFDDTKANNYLFVIGKIQDEIADHTQLAIRQIEKTKCWLEREIEKREKIITFLNNKLHGYIAGQDKKTITLPNGSLTMRSGADRVEVLDFDEFKAFCDEQGRPDLIRTKVTEDPDKKEIKKFIKDSGQIPDGLDLIKQPDKFTSKPELD